MKMKQQKGFFLLNLILSLALMGILYLAIMKIYFNNPAGLNKDTRKALMEQGVDVSNIPGLIQKAQQAANKANELGKQKEQEAQAMWNLNK